MANYPTSDPSFSAKSPGGQIQAAHINALQDEVVAIGAALRGTAQHSYTTANSVVASSNLSIGGNSTLGGGLQVNGGSSLTTLSVSGASTLAGALTLSGQARCLLTHSTKTDLASGVFTGLNWDTETVDVGAMHSTAVNSSRITIAVDGTYLISVTVPFNTNSSGTRGIRVMKNDATEVAGSRSMHAANPTAGTMTAVQSQTWVPLVATDYLTVQAIQESGSTGSVSTAAAASFAVARLY